MILFKETAWPFDQM